MPVETHRVSWQESRVAESRELLRWGGICDCGFYDVHVVQGFLKSIFRVPNQLLQITMKRIDGDEIIWIILTNSVVMKAEGIY